MTAAQHFTTSPADAGEVEVAATTDAGRAALGRVFFPGAPDGPAASAMLAVTVPADRVAELLAALEAAR